MRGNARASRRSAEGLAAPVVRTAVPLVVAFAVLGPLLLGRGYALSYDMVFVPSPPLSERVLGLDGSVPRAVPSDLVVVSFAQVLPADLVQKGLLVAVVALSVAGAWRLAARLGTGPVGAALAGLVYAWSPFLAERLVLGHWALLLGFAALPWALEAAAAARDGDRWGLVRLCAWTLPAAAGGANAVLLLVPPVLVVLLWPDGREGGPGRRSASRALLYAGYVLTVSLPWVVPTLVRPGGLPSDPDGVDAFAARADGPLGTLGSLVTLGGIWNAGVVPTERGPMLVSVVTLLAVAAALAGGLPLLLRGDGTGSALAVAGGLALLLAGASALPGLDDVARVLVLHVPGGGVLRDAQKFLAAWVLLVACCAGAALQRCLPAARRAGLGALARAGALAVPLALLPTLAWGAGGRLQAVDYPQSWDDARAVMEADPVAGGVVLLPWGPYRRFAWNSDLVVLDPAQRVTSRPVVMNDDLPLLDRTVRGEDPAARRVAAVLDGSAPLAPALAGVGLRYALVHAGAAGAAEVQRRLSGTPCGPCDGDVVLYVLDPPPRTPAVRESLTGWRRAAIVAGLLAAGTAALVILATILLGRVRLGAIVARMHIPRAQVARPRGDEGVVTVLAAAAIAAVVGGLLAVVSGVAVTGVLASDSTEQVTTPLVRYDQ